MSFAGTQMFRRVRNGQGMWKAAGASSVHLSHRDTMSRDESRQGVPKIMKPRLVAGTVESQNTGLSSKPLELMVSMTVTDHHAYLCGEESGRALVAKPRPMSHSVKSHDTNQIFSDRD